MKKLTVNAPRQKFQFPRKEPSEKLLEIAHLAQATQREGIPLSAYTVAKLGQEIQGLSHTLRRIATNQCNGYRELRQELREGGKEESLKNRAREVFAYLGLSVQFQGDPRGAMILVHSPKTGDELFRIG